VHSVNAVKIHNSAEMSIPEISLTAAQPFKHIVFHHPHLGVENMHRHRALLGHFFHAATHSCVLAHRGVIHVSVGGRQAEDWRLHEQATRHGLVLLLQTVCYLLFLSKMFFNCFSIRIKKRMSKLLNASFR
jgi:hypothetical protein